MAWPTTKASNQYTDSGQDRIADARAEINQNITNVNAIIDEFNISSPSDGDLLQYSSSSGKWEQVASSSIGGGSNFSVVWGSFVTPVGIGDAIQAIENTVPNNGELTVSTGANTWTFDSTGTYYFKVNALAHTSTSGYSWRIKNNTQSTYVTWDTLGSDPERTTALQYSWKTLSVTSTSDTYSFVLYVASSLGTLQDVVNTWSIDIMKA